MSQQPCLPVGRRRKRPNEGSESHRPNWTNVASMDAMEYMQRVVSEASALPDMFIAGSSDDEDPREKEDKTTKVDDSTNSMQSLSSPAAIKQPDHSNKKTKKGSSPSPFLGGSAAALEYLVSGDTDMVPPPSDHHVPVAGKTWAERTLDAFSRLRLYVEQVKEASGGVVEKTIAVPPMKDRAGWHEFCVGKQDSEGNAGDYFQDDSDNTNMRDTEESDVIGMTDNDVPLWRQGLPPETGFHLPTTSLLLQMDQVMVRRVLSHLTYFVCEGWALTPARSAWLYALATRMDRPVHRDDAVEIYKLVKRLTAMRAELKPPLIAQENEDSLSKTTDTLLGRINTLILIFAVYFEQGGGYESVMQPVAK